MNSRKKILVIDDEASMRKNIHDILYAEGYEVLEAGDGDEGLELTRQHNPKLILLDFNLPRHNGIFILEEIKKTHPDVPVIIFTAYSTNERVIEAMKAGAYDYLEKPFELEDFLLTITRGISYASLVSEVKELRGMVTDVPDMAHEFMVAKSTKMKEIFKTVGKIAQSDATVLIQGESGTGKEMIADAIQKYSARNEQPFVKVNCGALAETLLESEIFGHEKGAFTGAVAQKAGKFEIANGGTVFLDEINTMPHSLQVRLLRVLQNKSFYRVGGETVVPVDVRVIAATNKDIEHEVEEGRFRKDLFYRLNVIRLTIPPLRDRKEDIPLLAEHFIKKYSPAGKLVLKPESMEELVRYGWPGNVRELENLIQRGVVMARENIITVDIPRPPEPLPRPQELQLPPEETPYKEAIEGFEKSLILRALTRNNWNKTETARFLKMNRRLLYTKMKDYGLLRGKE